MSETPDFNYDLEEEFRDSIATVSREGKRIWIYPKKPGGIFYNYRKLLSYLLLATLFAMPWIRVDGNQFMLIDVIERKFVFFGVPFYPQDFFMFAIAMITFIVFIILFTVIFGRIFCGWICPQTIFMEMVYRRIEYWIEGDYNRQKKLDAGSWTFEKFWKKTVKHLLFFGIAILIANTFLSYIIGSEKVSKIVSEPFQQHLGGFISMLIFSAIFYGVFAFMREQVCTTVCPYGRLQGVMLDKNSIVISYDWIRGEPRGKIQKQKETSISLPVLGDCIDCNLCVKVCPTGIDIRNGTQLECINCTACIDACDEVMEKVSKPKGLIRYDSYNGIERGSRHIFTGRSIAYTLLLFILVFINLFMISTRKEVDIVIMRTPGQLYNKTPEGNINNLYNYQLVNKTNKAKKINFELIGSSGTIRLVGNQELILPADTILSGSMFITLSPDQLKKKKTELKINVDYGDEQQLIKTSFLGPLSK